MRTKAEIIEAIKEYFESDNEAFVEVIEELDGWNGYLGDDRYYPMDELPELMGDDIMNILQRVYYGHDEDYCTDASGNKQYSEFCPNKEYFTFNGYGNLVSASEKDYSAHLDDYFVESVIENRYEIRWAIENHTELVELLDEYDEAEEAYEDAEWEQSIGWDV